MTTNVLAPVKPGYTWQQQVLALDSKYPRQASCNPSFGMLYLRRRNELLREKSHTNTPMRLSYVKLRSQVLKQRYGAPVDAVSVSSGTGDVVVEVGREKLKSAGSFAFAGVHHVFDQHTAAVSDLKFANNDRSKLCCASFDGTITICDVSTPPRVIAQLDGHTKGVTAIDWSTSNDLIVSSSHDGTVRLWGVDDLGDRPPVCLRVVADQVHAQVLCCCFVPANNNLVITGNSQGFVQILNVSTGIYSRGGTSKIGGKVLALTCEESGGSLVWVGNERGVVTSLRLDAGSGRLSKLRRIEIMGSAAVTSLSWRSWLSRQSPAPTLLVSSACNAIFLYSVADSHGCLKIQRKYPLKHRQWLVRSTFCPQMGASFIASGSEDGSIHLLDTTREGKAAQVNRLYGHSAPILSLDFNYDESHLASGDQQGLIIVWRN